MYILPVQIAQFVPGNLGGGTPENILAFDNFLFQM
jgi:hypothetical protein